MNQPDTWEICIHHKGVPCFRDALLERSIISTSKADWLRSEIEKLEIRVEETKKYWNEKAPHNCGLCWEEDYCYHEIERNVLTSIITRYKEELLELEKGV